MLIALGSQQITETIKTHRGSTDIYDQTFIKIFRGLISQ